jgi:EpsI family protein
VSRKGWRWAPAAVLLLGIAAAEGGVGHSSAAPLRAPLGSAVPASIEGYLARELPLPGSERGMAEGSDQVARTYTAPDGSSAFAVLVAYSPRRVPGEASSSPEMAVPGPGWARVAGIQPREIALSTGTVPVSYGLIERDGERALILSWYQGRGRVVADRFQARLYRLRDQILRGRTDEALVRVVVPLAGEEEEAFRLATRVVHDLVPAIADALAP